MMSELNVIICADIFGASPEFIELCQQISSNATGAMTVNYHFVGPYQVQPDALLSEKGAYQYFTEHVGVNTYSEKLLSVIAAIKGPKLLIGFSVGGSVIWQLMPELASNDVRATVCFYSSQIRHMTEIVPTVPCQLILPKSEVHFSVTELLTTMHGKRQVDAEQCCYQHGFLNKLSENYSRAGAKVYTRAIQNTIAATLKSL